MMNKRTTVFALLLLTLVIYGLKTLLVGDIEGTKKFLFNAMGVLPLNLLLITFIFNKLLGMHTKKALSKKRNMLMNAFFSEFGTTLLRTMVRFDSSRKELLDCSDSIEKWEGEKLIRLRKCFRKYIPVLKIELTELTELHKLLNKQHHYILTLLQHPAMQAHENFSDLVWAMFHLEDELNHRDGEHNLPETDVAHLTGDLLRAYTLLLSQWVEYMGYLKTDYPYLYSLAIRTSPFNEKTSAVIT